MSAVAYKYLPWLRDGAAALITTDDDLPTAPASFETQAEVHFTGGFANTAINLFGPGDIVGLAKGQITRREPVPGSTGFEPNYFPLVEFRDPDMPWRLTPTRAARQDQLRPWLALIAIEQRGDVAVRSLDGSPLPRIAAPVSQLPDPEELDRWAHVQVSGPFPSPNMSPGELIEYVKNNPSRAVARVMCPRRLRPNTAYLLCLVPVFKVGCLAGLGEDFDPDALKLQYAWSFSEESNETVTLPVYDSWVVNTGPARDPREEFERLARALHPYQIPAEDAVRPFSVEAPLTANPPLTMELPGALRPVDASPSAPAPSDVRTALGQWINQNAQYEDAGGNDPEVTPPLYGRWQSGTVKTMAAGTPVWVNELNLDPRMRAIAAMGGDIVQRHQDEFIAEAWLQAGQVREANQLLHGAQLARGLNQALTRKHFEALPADMLLQMIGPDRARIRHGNTTLQRTVSSSAVPNSGVEATFRRVARVRGPHTRHWNIGQVPEDADVLFRQGWQRFDPGTDWSTFDEGTVNAPSKWVRDDNAVDKPITQNSNIHSLPNDVPSIPKLGTMYVTGDPAWRDVQYYASMLSNDDDTIGIVFRFSSTSSYYRFSMDRERRQRRLVKRLGAGWFLLWQDSFQYTQGVEYRVKVLAEGDHIQIFFNENKIIDLRDTNGPLISGRVGLYTWGNQISRFRNLTVYAQSGLDTSELRPPVVVDQGNNSGPSAWTTQDGDIKQTSNIYTEPRDRDELSKLGTYAKAAPDSAIPQWTDYYAKVHLMAEDDDDIGLMFRYNGPGDHYRFSMDAERSYQRLVKCVNGRYTLLWQRDEGFELNRLYRLEIIADGSRLRGYLDFRMLFDVRDRSHPKGTVAFYCWGVAGAHFRLAAVKRLRRQGVMSRLNASQLGVPVPPGGQLNLTALKTNLLSALDQSRVVAERTMERLSLPSRTRSSEDPLASVGRAPRLAVPLSTRLMEHSPELMLPGVGQIPDNSVVALETNPDFVAALLVGANHEMTRELLWRGPNTDLRATVFRQFWDVRGASPNGSPEDIGPIHQWNSAGTLASQVAGGQSRSVFLIRSELLRRFPDARFYMVRAISDGTGGRKPDGTPALPQFRGRFGDDIAFFGFSVPPEEVTGEDGGLGYYFVIEQRPGASRFGLLLEAEDGDPNDWTELRWDHVDGAAYARATPPNIENPPPGPVWGRNAAHVAAITQRRPFRLLMHARRLLVSES